MREQEVDLLARVSALEHLVKHLFWNVVVLTADKNEMDDRAAIDDLHGFIGNLHEELEFSSVPGLDPALSDHFSDAVRQHIRRVLTSLVQEMEAEQDGS